MAPLLQIVVRIWSPYCVGAIITAENQKASQTFICKAFFVAGETRFELATNGFGDHYSTVEPLPYVRVSHTPTLDFPCLSMFSKGLVFKRRISV